MAGDPDPRFNRRFHLYFSVRPSWIPYFAENFLGDVPEIGGESDLGSPGCLLQDALLILECKPNWTHAHSRTIAPTVIGARVFRMEPPIEEAAVSGIRVAPADLADRFKIRATGQDRLCDSNGEHGVIGEVTERAKQREILRLDRTMLVD